MILGSSLGNRLLGSSLSSYSKNKSFPAQTQTARKYGVSREAIQQHLALELNLFPSEKRMEGVAQITFVCKVETLTSLELNAKELQIDKVWIASLPQEKSDRAVPNFNNVNNVDLVWHEVHFQNADSKLLAQFNNCPVKRAERFTLKIQYSVTKPNAGVYFISKAEGVPEAYECVFTQGQDTDSPHWFPCQDDPRLKISSQVTIQFPKSWCAASNGVRVSQVVKNDTKCEVWQMNTPHSPYLLAFVAGELLEFKGKWREKTVTALLPVTFSYLGDECVREMKDMLEFYSNYWNFEYPFEQYTQSFVREFPFGGMENTTCTINTDEVLGPISFSKEEDFRSILVMHEMAHQWFGDTVTCDTWSEGWLNEGFATHSETLWQEHVAGSQAGLFYQEFECKQGYLDESVIYQRPMVTNHYEFPSEIFDAHLYQKGSMVLHYLRGLLGHSVFTAAVGAYLTKYKFMPVTTTDFRRTLEDVSGRDLEEFFDHYVLSAGHVELSVTYKCESENSVSIEVSQTQECEQSVAEKCYESAVIVVLEDGTSESFVCRGRNKVETFVFRVNSKAQYAFFDPSSLVVGKVTHKLTENQCLSILKSAQATSWFKYCAGLCVLKDFPSSIQKSGLFAWIESETTGIVRRECYTMCSVSASVLAQEFVLHAKESDPKIFPYWVGTLGNLKQLDHKNVVQRLIHVIESAPGDVSKIKALLALAKWAQSSSIIRSVDFTPTLVKVAEQQSQVASFNGLVAAAALDLYTELASDMPHLGIAPQAALTRLKEFYLDKGPLVSRRTVSAAKGIAKISGRFPTLRLETRPILESLVQCTEPTRLLTQVPTLLARSNDSAMVEGLGEFLERKPYGVLSMILPRARRSLKKLVKNISGGEISEKLLSFEEFKTKLEKLETEVKELKAAGKVTNSAQEKV